MLHLGLEDEHPFLLQRGALWCSKQGSGFSVPCWCPFSKTKRTQISVSAQRVAQPADALQWRRTSFENNLVFINQQEFSVWGPSAGIKKKSTCGPGLLSENRQVASLGCTEEQISYGSGMSAPCFQFQWHLAGFCMLKFRLSCLRCRQQATHLLCSVALWIFRFIGLSLLSQSSLGTSF